MKNKVIFKEMLELQDSFNKVVHPEWKEQNFDWVTAILTESAEAIDELHWKWWKSGEDNITNFKNEIVDIWHFVMSYNLSVSDGVSDALVEMFDDVYNIDDVMDEELEITLIEHLQMMNMHLLNSKYRGENIEDFSSAMIELIYHLFAVMKKVQIDSVDELYKLYSCKNVLNAFRQANGYKEGTYRKLWIGTDGKKYDDSLMAYEIFDSVETEDKFKGLYSALELAYSK